MINLPVNDDGEVNTIAGYRENGDPVSGTTTNETINTMFSDLWDGDNAITNEEYQAIITRCESNGWNAWKATWQMWKTQGYLD